jgi:hypothetical protein
MALLEGPQRENLECGIFHPRSELDDNRDNPVCSVAEARRRCDAQLLNVPRVSCIQQYKPPDMLWLSWLSPRRHLARRPAVRCVEVNRRENMLPFMRLRFSPVGRLLTLALFAALCSATYAQTDTPGQERSILVGPRPRLVPGMPETPGSLMPTATSAPALETAPAEPTFPTVMGMPVVATPAPTRPANASLSSQGESGLLRGLDASGAALRRTYSHQSYPGMHGDQYPESYGHQPHSGGHGDSTQVRPFRNRSVINYLQENVRSGNWIPW